MQQGRQEGEAALLQSQLARRFGTLPDAVRTRLTSATVDQLESWATKVLDAESLDGVFDRDFVPDPQRATTPRATTVTEVQSSLRAQRSNPWGAQRSPAANRASRGVDLGGVLNMGEGQRDRRQRGLRTPSEDAIRRCCPEFVAFYFLVADAEIGRQPAYPLLEQLAS
ncbi:DUF4351 domain-containing protein [Accumulibacter sp.]|uniref:DUF4351 domain-containing protein n=1 Tax=Accumulibacter sp. TaxID=2053492 RepID=UPI003443561A